MNPLVSVIVPVFNSEGTVAASLQSLFQQTLQEIEIIAVNDASTDGSGKVLDRLARDEARLKVIHLAENHGVHEARAAGIRVATASWIGFLDADDFAKPEMFEILHRSVTSNDADIAVCGIEQLSSKQQDLGTKLRFPGNRVLSDGLFQGFCSLRFGTGALWNKLYHADLMTRWGTVAFRWRQDANEDTLVNIGCFLEARTVCLREEALYQYVANPESATQAVDDAKSFTRFLRAYAVAIDTYGQRGEAVRTMITELYQRQLEICCYLIEDPRALDPHRAEISEALLFLSQCYPEGLATLLNRMPLGKPQASFRGTLGDVFRKTSQLPGLAFRAGQRLLSSGSVG